MILREANLRQLQKRYRDRMPDRAGTYDEQRVVAEVRKFYSLVEICSLAGLLPRPLSPEFSKLARGEVSRVLESASGERSSDLRLLRLLRARLDGGWGHKDLKGDGLVAGIFSQFLTINAMVEDSREVELFLDAVSNSSASLSMEEKGEVPIQRLQGLAEYLAFLQEFEHLLELARGFPHFQSGIWHYHSLTVVDLVNMQKIDPWLAAIEMHYPRVKSEGDHEVAGSSPIPRVLATLRTTDYESPLLRFDPLGPYPPVVDGQQFGSALRGIQVGASQIGEDNEVVQIDLMIGRKSGQCGEAFAHRLAQQTSGHSAGLALLDRDRNLPAKPFTVVYDKAMMNGTTKAAQMFHAANSAVAAAVVDSVAEGVIPGRAAEDLVLLVGVFIHWKATDRQKIQNYTYLATKDAILQVMSERLSIDDIRKVGNALKPLSPARSSK